MSDEWLDSTERALEVVEGQIGMARVVNAKAVQVELGTLQKLYDEVLRFRESLDLGRAVVEAAVVWHTHKGSVDGNNDELWIKTNAMADAVSTFIKAREKKEAM